MLVAIHQPSYFPWLGLLHKLARCEVYVLMDEVQLSDSAYQHRNLFLAKSGEAKYLTIPIVKKNYLEKTLAQLSFAKADWQLQHQRFLQDNYRKHPHFDEVWQSCAPIFTRPYDSLGAVLVDVMRLCLGACELPCEIVLQSELEYDRTSRKSDLVVALLEATSATTYLSGTGSQAYLEESALADKHIALIYDRFSHPTYPQHNAPSFVPGLACLDAAFNLGWAGVAKLVKE